MVSLRWNTRILSAVALDISGPGKEGLELGIDKEFRKYQNDGLDIKLSVLHRDREAKALCPIRKRYV
ncbi:uncharacterized protein BT62DRAFT_925934 [Guyanagaster necrorhizus]|uniref:Uncharacterized protein n=1 Tax=Guyanagaster necrorhizus TaxID=856835 RepID=A0A9P7W321_9AGAR|nr:uncharacterized protein BT62DRAFT_925934 [Guyanagaster necrorhizus MCA 3950]KAG7451753.1 hypothetical protein BT62DRAFT_925934 [Guyanagaster necrorhizus MCA 3950]